MIPDVIGGATSSTQEALESGRIQRLHTLAKSGDLKKASQEFESYFLSYMFKLMQTTVPKGSLIPDRREDVFQTMYAETIGKQAAEAGGIGLAQLIESSLRANGFGQVEGRLSKDLTV